MADSKVFYHLTQLKAGGRFVVAKGEGAHGQSPWITDTGRLLLILQKSIGEAAPTN